MWVAHLAIAVISIILLFTSYFVPLNWQSPGTLLWGLFKKTVWMIAGLCGVWYGMYMLGWRLVQVAS